MAKIFLCVAICVYFVQAFAAPRTLSDLEIQVIRTGLEEVPGIQTKSVENIVDTLKKYRSSPVDLLTIALQGDTCAKNRLNLRRVIETALDDTEEENTTKNDPQKIEIIFTNNQLNAVTNELSKFITPESVQRARKIFRGFQEDASPEELESGSVELLASAARAVSFGCPSENSLLNKI